LETPISDPTKADKPQRFVFALVEDFSHMAFSCAVDPLRIANLISSRDLYTWSFAPLDGETATSPNTSVTLTHHRFPESAACEQLFVLSVINMQLMEHSVLLNALRRIDRTCKTKNGALYSGGYIFV
jgi:transcriptional regulator GlxA family with amidase domain